MPVEQYRDPKVIHKEHLEILRFNREMTEVLKEKPGSPVHLSVAGPSDEPIIGRDTSLDHLLPPALRKKS